MGFCRNILPSSGGAKRLYLFKDGDQCSDVTGGWTNYVEGNGGSYTADIRENSLYIGGSGNGRKGWKPKNSLSADVLNKYDYAFFEYKARGYSSDNGGRCEFYADKNGSCFSDENCNNRDMQRIIALPLTNDMIKFALQMNGYSTSYMWVSKVWLEKVGD